MRLKLTERALADFKLPGQKARLTIWDTAQIGFGVRVGRRSQTFVVKGRFEGEQGMVKIGIVGKVRDDGHTWNVQRARSRARELLAEMDRGVDPNNPHKVKDSLRAGLTLHVENMRKKKRSPRSIESIESEVQKHFKDWLDRPIAQLGVDELKECLKTAKKNVRPRMDSVNQPGEALCNRLLRHIKAIWNSMDREHDLPGKNPATRIVTTTLSERKERVNDGEFGEWYAKVTKLEPVRRDLQLFALFTAIRADGICHLRWDDIDHKRGLVHVRQSKGDTPYTIPMPAPCATILKRRERENRVLFADHKGDDGWVFPALTRASPRSVIPLAEPKQWHLVKDNKGNTLKDKDGKYIKVRTVLGLHALRRTHNSVAKEIGIANVDRETLLNQNQHGVNIKHYAVPQNWDHVAKQQKRIADALLERLKIKSV